MAAAPTRLPPWLPPTEYSVVAIPNDGNCFYLSLYTALRAYNGPRADNVHLRHLITACKREGASTVVSKLRRTVGSKFSADNLEGLYVGWVASGRPEPSDDPTGQTDVALIPMFRAIEATPTKTPTPLIVGRVSAMIRRTKVTDPPAPAGQTLPLVWADETAIGIIEAFYGLQCLLVDVTAPTPALRAHTQPEEGEQPKLFVTMVYTGRHYEVLSVSADPAQINAVFLWNQVPELLRQQFCGTTGHRRELRRLGIDCAGVPPLGAPLVPLPAAAPAAPPQVRPVSPPSVQPPEAGAPADDPDDLRAWMRDNQQRLAEAAAAGTGPVPAPVGELDLPSDDDEDEGEPADPDNPPLPAAHWEAEVSSAPVHLPVSDDDTDADAEDEDDDAPPAAVAAANALLARAREERAEARAAAVAGRTDPVTYARSLAQQYRLTPGIGGPTNVRTGLVRMTRRALPNPDDPDAPALAPARFPMENIQTRLDQLRRVVEPQVGAEERERRELAAREALVAHSHVGAMNPLFEGSPGPAGQAAIERATAAASAAADDPEAHIPQPVPLAGTDDEGDDGGGQGGGGVRTLNRRRQRPTSGTRSKQHTRRRGPRKAASATARTRRSGRRRPLPRSRTQTRHRRHLHRRPSSLPRRSTRKSPGRGR